MNFFDHKNLGNHLLQLCPKVVKHPVYIYISGPLPKWENYAVSHTAAIVSSSLYKAQSINWKQVP